MVMMYRAVTFNFVKLIKHGVFNLNTDFKMPIKNKKCKKKKNNSSSIPVAFSGKINS